MGLSLNGYHPLNASVQFGDAKNKNVANRPGSTQAAGNAPPTLTPQQQQEQTKIAQIQSQYAGICGCTNCTGNPSQKAEDVLAKVRADSKAHIVGHEQAHQAAAGSLGGQMSIEYNKDGVAVAGHVPISIPGLDKNNPESTMKSYQTVRSAALAPSDPSGQDMSVASQAQSLMGQAKVLIDQKPSEQPEAQHGQTKPGPNACLTVCLKSPSSGHPLRHCAAPIWLQSCGGRSSPALLFPGDHSN